MSQPTDPRNDFIEFVQIWGGSLDMYLEGVFMYDSRNGSKYKLRHFSNGFAAVFLADTVLNHCRVYSSSRVHD